MKSETSEQKVARLRIEIQQLKNAIANHTRHCKEAIRQREIEIEIELDEQSVKAETAHNG